MAKRATVALLMVALRDHALEMLDTIAWNMGFS
jgi:hypothetical protein